MNGKNGSPNISADIPGKEAAGGPGGYAGGLIQGDGLGPGGGEGKQGNTTYNGTITAANGTYLGTYGNRKIQPLVGGSGGGGAVNTGGNASTGGGGGGGAILISSSASIEIAGSILCNGGAGRSILGGNLNKSVSGNGSGGAIRLVGNRISGSGTLSAVEGELPSKQPMSSICISAQIQQLST